MLVVVVGGLWLVVGGQWIGGCSWVGDGELVLGLWLVEEGRRERGQGGEEGKGGGQGRRAGGGGGQRRRAGGGRRAGEEGRGGGRGGKNQTIKARSHFSSL